MFGLELTGKPAKEFENIKAWINTKPLTLKDLRGKVVLLDFWTYSCVNCIRSLPHIKSLHEKYSKQGLVVIGVHTPEFEFEKELKNVKFAVKKLGIKYPVALDSDNTTWQLYGNRYWPRQALIDSNGKIRYEHVGEGGYEEIEENIAKLLGEFGIESKRETEELIQSITPEIYLGSERSPGFGSNVACTPEGCDHFVDTGNHNQDLAYLQGDWYQKPEYVQHANEKEDYVLLKYTAKVCNIVVGNSGKSFKVYITLDGNNLTKENAEKDIQFESGKSFILVDHPDMYEIIKTKKVDKHEVKILTTSKDFSIYTFTFG